MRKAIVGIVIVTVLVTLVASALFLQGRNQNKKISDCGTSGLYFFDKDIMACVVPNRLTDPDVRNVARLASEEIGIGKHKFIIYVNNMQGTKSYSVLALSAPNDVWEVNIATSLNGRESTDGSMQVVATKENMTFMRDPTQYYETCKAHGGSTNLYSFVDACVDGNDVYYAGISPNTLPLDFTY
jgi:hypothetical protein